jgi:hypothetical protein
VVVAVAVHKPMVVALVVVALVVIERLQGKK